MKTITGKTKAWMTFGAELRALENTKGNVLVSMLGYSEGDMTEHGWVEVGGAEITLSLPEASVLLHNQIEALRRQQRDALAKAEKFEQKINNLLAIGNDVRGKVVDESEIPF